MSKDIDTKSDYFCYIDSGIFRNGRKHFIEDFEKSSFKINKLNDIVINYSEDFMKMDINFDDLINRGNYEASCNSMIFSRNVIDEIVKLYFSKLDSLIENSINTTEQRIMTIILREYWKKHPDKFTFVNQNSSYHVNFHL